MPMLLLILPICLGWFMVTDLMALLGSVLLAVIQMSWATPFLNVARQ